MTMAGNGDKRGQPLRAYVFTDLPFTTSVLQTFSQGSGSPTFHHPTFNLLPLFFLFRLQNSQDAVVFGSHPFFTWHRRPFSKSKQLVVCPSLIPLYVPSLTDPNF